MYIKIFTYQQYLILYVDPNIKNIHILLNESNKQNIYYIICDKDQNVTHAENNVFLIKIKENYWNSLICHNNLIKTNTYKLKNMQKITFDFLCDINLKNYTSLISDSRIFIVNGQLNIYKKLLLETKEQNLANENQCTVQKNFYDLINSICEKFLGDFNYEDYHKITLLQSNSNINLFKTEIYELMNLNNVIYENKTFYDASHQKLNIKDIENDYEMRHYKQRTYLKDKIEITLNSNVLVLDYIYDHYNFGEFVDVLKRLIYLKNTRDLNLEIMRLEKTDVKEIENYFNKFDFKLNTNKINWNYNKSYKIKNCYVNICKSKICRNFISDTTRFFLNKLFNSHELNLNLKYKLFLSRGTGKRFSINNEYFYSELLKRGFVFLNGSESLNAIQKHFTNASIIVGEHGSLFQNVYFCKKNPLIIELSPTKFGQHMPFMGNSTQMGFLHLIFFLEAINLENEIEGTRGPLHLKYNDDTVNKILTLIDCVEI